MPRPLVSAIIDNYNYARFLPDAIDSALNQTYPNLEVIVVDDGSTDESPAIIRGYGARITPILKENGGQASAFNAGFAASRGELVAFLDADDVWEPDRIADLVTIAEAHPDANLIYNQLQNIDAEGRPFGSPWPRNPTSGSIERRTLQSGGYWLYPPTSGLCFRRRLLERIMDVPAYKDGHLADSYLADIAPFTGPVVGIRKPLTRYRHHGSNHWESRSMAARAEVYEVRVARLNDALARLSSPHRVRLEDHWPYQRIRYVHRLGPTPSFVQLTLLAYRFPAEAGLVPGLRRVAGFWKNIAETRWRR